MIIITNIIDENISFNERTKHTVISNENNFVLLFILIVIKTVFDKITYDITILYDVRKRTPILRPSTSRKRH